MKRSRAYHERKKRFERDPDYILHGLLYDIAEDIYVAMEERGWTQAELAKKAGMQASFVSRFLNTPSNTELRTVVRLADALGLKYEHRLVPSQAIRQDVKESMDFNMDALRDSLEAQVAGEWQTNTYSQRRTPANAIGVEEDRDGHPELDAVA